MEKFARRKIITIEIPLTIGINEDEINEEEMVDMFSQKLIEAGEIVRDSRIFDVFQMNLADSRLHIVDELENTKDQLI